MTDALPMLGAARPERSDAAANRVKILAVTRALFLEHGPDGVAMDAVARAAGVGKGTVFRRFGDRDGLMEALLDEDLRAFQDAFLSGPPPLGPGAPAGERLDAFVVRLVEMQRANLALALAVHLSSAGVRARFAGVLLVHIRGLIRAIDPTLNAHVLAPMLLGALAPPVLDRLPEPHRDDVEAIVAAARVLLAGLGRSNGP